MTKYLILFIILFSFFLFPQPVFAHVLETDGSIGAVLHINPDDDPIAGEQTSMFFAMKDKENKFAIANCVCMVTVKQNGKVIHQETVTDPTFFYSFPKKDIYQVTFSGKPANDKMFQAFSLTYDIRVARDGEQKTAFLLFLPSNFSYYLLPFGLVLFIIILVKTQQKRMKGGEK